MIEGKIAVVGSGAIGLYYGGKLAAAGRDVRFLMRSGFDEARREGIRIVSTEEDGVHLGSPRVYRSTHEIGPADLVVVALKATSNHALNTLLPPLLHDGTALLTLENGLGSDEALAAQFGADRVLGGLCFICLTRRSPACVAHTGGGPVSIGEFAGPASDRVRELVAALCAAEVKARSVEDLAAERWKKLVWNIPFNGLGVAGGGISVDRVLADPELLAECEALMREVQVAASALGHPIEQAFVDHQIERTYPMGAYFPSTVTDWREGKELEVEAIWGEPLRRAQAAGLPMPRLARLHERLTALNRTKAK